MQMKDKANKEQKKSSLYGKVNVQNIKNEIYTKQNNSGITLVALVITTIVLLILAGIVVKLSIGENGIITRAKDATNKYNTAQDDEIAMFNKLANEYDKVVSGNWGGGTTDPSNPSNHDTNNVTPTPGGEEPDTPTPGPSNEDLTEEEKDSLTSNGIKEIDKSEISNENLKDNENIKGVITGEVPIPTGTEYKEGTKETGVVITDGTSKFVWVPEPNIDEMAVLQSGSTTNYQGVLYDFEGTTATKKEILQIDKTTESSGNREPDVLKGSDGDISKIRQLDSILNTKYTSTGLNQFKLDLQNDFNEMVESVKKYKGFFVGRYETSLISGIVYSRKGVSSADFSNWYYSYAYHKKMATLNGYTSLKSHMIWGCNYDAMLRWGLQGVDAKKITGTGNADYNLISDYHTGEITIEGKEDKINNIYDLEGNKFEWIAEAVYFNRTYRGGDHSKEGSPSLRQRYNPSNAYSWIDTGLINNDEVIAQIEIVIKANGYTSYDMRNNYNVLLEGIMQEK